MRKHPFGGHLRKRSQGSAAFGTWRDARRAGLVGSAGEGVILGQLGRRDLVHSGNESVLCIGDARSGKTSSVAVRTIRAWSGGDVMVVDPKSAELYELTAGWLEGRGYEVIRFDPFAVGAFAQWNPLQEIPAGPGMYEAARRLAQDLIEQDPRGQSHWPRSAQALFVVLAMHVLNDVLCEPTLAMVRRLVSSGPNEAMVSRLNLTQTERQDLAALAPARATLQVLSEYPHRVLLPYPAAGGGYTDTLPVVEEMAKRFLRVPDREFGSILSTFQTAMDPLMDPRVEDATQRSTMSLRRFGRTEKPVALYLTLPEEQFANCRGLVRALVTSMWSSFRTRQRYRDAAVSTSRRALLVLEEFPGLGRMEVLERALATAGGYGLVVLLLAQNRSQILSTWGQHEPVTGGCPVRVVMGSQDQATRQWVSELAGRATIEVRRASRSSRALGAGWSQTRSESETGRNLVTADEVGRLPEGSCLVLAPRMLPVLARALRYYEEADVEAVSPPPQTSSRALVDQYCPWASMGWAA